MVVLVEGWSDRWMEGSSILRMYVLSRKCWKLQGDWFNKENYFLFWSFCVFGGGGTKRRLLFWMRLIYMMINWNWGRMETGFLLYGWREGSQKTMMLYAVVSLVSMQLLPTIGHAETYTRCEAQVIIRSEESKDKYHVSQL